MHRLVARTLPLFALAALSIGVSVQVGCSNLADDSMSEDNFTGYGYGHHGYGNSGGGQSSSSSSSGGAYGGY